MPTSTTKRKVIDKEWVQDYSRWGVQNYDVPLFINNTVPIFDNLTCSLDVEDDEQGNFIGLGIYDSKVCWYWSDFELAKQIEIPKFIAHNGISDIRKLQNWGFKIDESWLIYDTQLMAHILDSSRKQYGLKKLVADDLGMEYPSYEDLTGKKTSKSHITLRELPVELVAQYNAMDTYTTYKLYEQQRTLTEMGARTAVYTAVSYFKQIEQSISVIFDKMQSKGICIDLEYLKRLKVELEAQREPLEKAIKNELGDINLNSPKQLLGALNEKGINPQFKGKASTDKRALENFRNNKIVSLLLKYSETDTLLSSFVSPYLERGQDVVHPNYYQCGTRTGRPSCSNPNLLQIPRRTENGKKVRRMFVSRPGCLFGDCDYGQIEPRMLAHFSKDTNMLKMFNDGVDFHTFTSEKMGIDRERAKILNLSVGYRATFVSVSQQLKCSRQEAQKEIDAWWSIFPELYDWQQKLFYEVKKDGYLTTLKGLRIKIEDLDHGNEWRRGAAERRCIENIASASAQEVMKFAMIQADKDGINILVQIYDELLIEEKEEDIEAAMQVLTKDMESAILLEVPLVVDGKTGKNWLECH